MKAILFFLVLLSTPLGFAGTSKNKPTLSCKYLIKSAKSSVLPPKRISKICHSITKTIQLLKKMGLSIPKDIRVEIMPQEFWPNIFPPDAKLIAITEIKTGTVYIRSYKATKGLPSVLFGNSMNYEAYLSYINHEVAHAVSLFHYAEQTEGKLIPHEQSEFLAYFVQISLLPEELRDTIIQKFEAKKWTRFESIEEINHYYHLINPFGFAVKSFEFVKTDQGLEYLSNLLEGKIRKNSGYSK